MVDNHKFRKFLDKIKFGPMDSGKDTFLDDLQMTKSFNLTTDYLAHSLQKKKKIHFRETSEEVQKMEAEGTDMEEGTWLGFVHKVGYYLCYWILPDNESQIAYKTV